MIELILKLLEITESEHEYVNIAKGKYAIPRNFSEAKWQHKLRKDGSN